MSASELELLEHRLALRLAAPTSPQLRARILRQLGAARGRERNVSLGASVAAGFSLLVALTLASTSARVEERELRTPAAVLAPNLAAELGLDLREGQRMQLLLANARVPRIAPPVATPAFDLLEEQ